ncbi:MAG: hypothetical protein EOM45_07525 [Clostridia bacterium]|nr:hypothetical protein [Clostridia bacterium]
MEDVDFVPGTDGNTRVYGMEANHSVPLEYIYRRYYFNGIDGYFSSPKPPYNGDYHLKLGNDQEYYFENVRFLSPYENSYEGFLFPQSKFIFDQEGYLQKVQFTWWIIRNRRYQKATKEDLTLRISKTEAPFYYYFPADKGWIQKAPVFVPSGELDVSQFRIHRSDLSHLYERYVDIVRACYWDTAGNEWSFMNHFADNREE